MGEEFYVGYEPDMPATLAVRIRRVAWGLVALALVLPAVLVFTQGRFAPGVFEYGRVRAFTGRVLELPYPALVVDEVTGASAVYWLVGPGKHGAEEIVRGLDGQRVRLSGSLIQRGEDFMIEAVPDSLVPTGDRSVAKEPLRSLGVVRLDGEIVDSKCHLGVMKPGEGPTHRDCAVRCLLGRIPPLFLPHGRADLGRLALVSDTTQPFDDAGEFAGRRVSVRGEILQRGAQRFLAVSRRDLRLID
jgi:hypothetical protein